MKDTKPYMISLEDKVIEDKVIKDKVIKDNGTTCPFKKLQNLLL